MLLIAPGLWVWSLYGSSTSELDLMILVGPSQLRIFWVLWVFFKFFTYFIWILDLYFWSCTLWFLWKQSWVPALWKTPLPYHIPSSSSLLLIPSPGRAAHPLQILSMLHLVHDPSHKIISDILLYYSLRIIISKTNIPRESLFPPQQPPAAITALTWMSSTLVVGGNGRVGWNRDRQTSARAVCVLEDLRKLNTGITFLPSFFMQLISWRGILISVKEHCFREGTGNFNSCWSEFPLTGLHRHY